MKSHPKSYELWFQRQFLIELLYKNIPSKELKEGLVLKELKQLEIILTVDIRNFHLWDYHDLVLDLVNYDITNRLTI